VALARSRYERFPTGLALANALADALDGRLHERWSDAPSPSPTTRATTLRVPRAAFSDPPPSPPASDPLKRTPLEGPSPVTVPVRFEERTPPRGVGSSPERLDAPSPTRRSRVSWMLAALVAAAAAISLMVAVRAHGPRQQVPRATLALLAAPPAPVVPTTPPAAVTPPIAAPPTVTPLPIPQAPVAATSPPRHRRHEHRHRARSPEPGGASSAPGLYDPPGI
jgi:hypothetical protein